MWIYPLYVVYMFALIRVYCMLCVRSVCACHVYVCVIYYFACVSMSSLQQTTCPCPVTEQVWAHGVSAQTPADGWRRFVVGFAPALQASVFLAAISGNKIQHSTYLTRLVDFFLLQTINHLPSIYNMKNQYFCRLHVIRIHYVVHYSSTYKSSFSPHSLWPRSAVTSWSHWPAGELQPGQSELLSASLPAHPPRELLTGRWNALRDLLRAGDLGPPSPAVLSSWVPFLSLEKGPWHRWNNHLYSKQTYVPTSWLKSVWNPYRQAQGMSL